MKKYFSFLLIATLGVACSSNDSETPSSDKAESMAVAFLENPSVVLNTEGNPIDELKLDASENADKVIKLTGENAEEVFSQAKEYSSCLVVTENHTAVRIVDFDDCAQSGSWGVCMPLAEGYIRKEGTMKPQGDYLNNIIGRPDDQERTVYLFH
ncbi:MAG: hypothetical protein EP346_10725 [Bacteroidetes bacterium]|uniref:Lipoprotein n=1 Tax=Phaeocystidibacter marisrubri TaxID=1577780 RepID=A0A6L3ZFT0_9FLAO|nr:hypothetical protein [Phaeocystidibacter marisrubri]KAB2816292.1 hypothetical protein F8C82_11445 [Phaeocystidibacter marisrubri]TNE27928.1 MAG: hypothetical protein EP346_10725 [Bacteroidota bacterium]GGH68292.1 hypothetical protein GCM10011318_08170 [Phaeocystidibacter marisrubri]